MEFGDRSERQKDTQNSLEGLTEQVPLAIYEYYEKVHPSQAKTSFLPISGTREKSKRDQKINENSLF